MKFLKKSPFKFLFQVNKLEVSEVSLIKFSEDGQTISNNYQNLDFTIKEGHGFGDLNILGLNKGTYKLTISKLNIHINIIVHEGVYWEADGFVLKK